MQTQDYFHSARRSRDQSRSEQRKSVLSTLLPLSTPDDCHSHTVRIPPFGRLPLPLVRNIHDRQRTCYPLPLLVQNHSLCLPTNKMYILTRDNTNTTNAQHKNLYFDLQYWQQSSNIHPDKKPKSFIVSIASPTNRTRTIA